MNSNLYKLLYSNSLYSNYKVSFKRINITLRFNYLSKLLMELVSVIWLSLIISANLKENKYGKI